MKIASWNINSIRIRTKLVENFLNELNPDILLLQEIKCLNEEFPDFFKSLGFNFHINGEKGRNGVAILIKKKINFDYLNFDSQILTTQSRICGIYIKSINISIINVYVPNGNPIENIDKFKFKIDWLTEFNNTMKEFMREKKNLVIGGDFNVIENIFDAKKFSDWRNDALGNINVRKKFRELISTGLVNSARLFCKPGSEFSFWDYQRASWERNDGILIDHFLTSPKITELISNFGIESKFRGCEKPSDHAPLWINLNV